MTKKPDQQDRNAADRERYLRHWASEKKQDGKWLSKVEYEAKTGKPGRKP